MVNGNPIEKIDGGGKPVTKVDGYPVITGNICSFSSLFYRTTD